MYRYQYILLILVTSCMASGCIIETNIEASGGLYTDNPQHRQVNNSPD